MASRAHVFPDYPLDREVSRRRRAIVFQTHDPVVLPRSRGWDINGGLIAAAAAATLLVAGATYAVFYTEPARLSETPTAPLEREYAPLGDFGSLNATKALSAPMSRAPSVAPAADGSISPTSVSPLESSTTPSDREVVIDDSAAGLQESLPQPAESAPSTAPYPDPTTTPPDAIAPADDAAPLSSDENPYR